jgi:hypothetical protein
VAEVVGGHLWAVTLNLYGHLYSEMTGPVMEALDALTATSEPAPKEDAAEAERKRKGDPR